MSQRAPSHMWWEFINKNKYVRWGYCLIWLISGRANLRRATDHRATVRLGYCPFRLLSVGLLSFGLMPGQVAVRRDTVLSG